MCFYVFACVCVRVSKNSGAAINFGGWACTFACVFVCVRVCVCVRVRVRVRVRVFLCPMLLSSYHLIVE